MADENLKIYDFSMFLNCPKLIFACRSSGGRSVQILGPATEKSQSPKLFCVRRTMHVVTYDLLVCAAIDELE